MRSVVFSLLATDSGQHGLPFRANVTNDARQIHFVFDPLCGGVTTCGGPSSRSYS